MIMLYRNCQGIESIAIATFARECGIIHIIIIAIDSE